MQSAAKYRPQNPTPTTNDRKNHRKPLCRAKPKQTDKPTAKRSSPQKNTPNLCRAQRSNAQKPQKKTCTERSGVNKKTTHHHRQKPPKPTAQKSPPKTAEMPMNKGGAKSEQKREESKAGSGIEAKMVNVDNFF